MAEEKLSVACTISGAIQFGSTLMNIGLEIHESPYLVCGDQTLIDVGMCFSNEPMICVSGEFGIRLEDHFYMSESGPHWFTGPSHSIEDPFGLDR